MHHLKFVKGNLLRALPITTLTLMTMGVVITQLNSIGGNIEQPLTLGGLLIMIFAAEFIS